MLYRYLIVCVVVGTMAAQVTEDVVDGSTPVPLQPVIIGGVAVANGKYPAYGRLKVNGWFTCGCSLVDKTHALTAAHCHEPFKDKTVTVSFGVADTRDTSHEQTRTVVSFRYWDTRVEGTWPDDIVILTLDAPLDLGTYVNTIDLATSADNFDSSSHCVACGFGFIDGTAKTMTNILQEAELNIISLTECRTVFASVPDTCVCARGSGTSGICSGDSGGPFYCRNSETDPYKLVGVAEFAAASCQPRHPSGFTDVRYEAYQSWFTSSLEPPPPPPPPPKKSLWARFTSLFGRRRRRAAPNILKT